MFSPGILPAAPSRSLSNVLRELSLCQTPLSSHFVADIAGFAEQDCFLNAFSVTTQRKPALETPYLLAPH